MATLAHDVYVVVLEVRQGKESSVFLISRFGQDKQVGGITNSRGVGVVFFIQVGTAASFFIFHHNNLTVKAMSLAVINQLRRARHLFALKSAWPHLIPN